MLTSKILQDRRAKALSDSQERCKVFIEAVSVMSVAFAELRLHDLPEIEGAEAACMVENIEDLAAVMGDSF